jgi:hypothetical protein
MKTDLRRIRIEARRANIDRFRKLLTGRLTRVERKYIMRRIDEERADQRSRRCWQRFCVKPAMSFILFKRAS